MVVFLIQLTSNSYIHEIPGPQPSAPSTAWPQSHGGAEDHLSRVFVVVCNRHGASLPAPEQRSEWDSTASGLQVVGPGLGMTIAIADTWLLQWMSQNTIVASVVASLFVLLAATLAIAEVARHQRFSAVLSDSEEPIPTCMSSFPVAIVTLLLFSAAVMALVVSPTTGIAQEPAALRIAA
jgi:hypothetical protein